MLTLTTIANILFFGVIAVGLVPIVLLALYAVGRLAWEVLKVLTGAWV
jgi:hypothetical protein